MSAEEKIFFSYNQIHNTIKGLAVEIIDSGFDPDLIVAIGTGGFIPARIIKTYIKKPILTVGLSLYDENNKPKAAPREDPVD